jgi:hypothetical protein
MVLEIGSKLHTLLVEHDAAVIVRAKNDRTTFTVYRVRGKRFLVVDSGPMVELFAPVPASPGGDVADTLRRLLETD